MFRKTLIVAALATLAAPVTWASVSADEAKQLGTTLTPVGAEKAGNKDGTIPEYTGGLTTPPAGFQKGSNKRPDPFADEKPRLVITGKDMAAQADKLTEGTKELLKRYPTKVNEHVQRTNLAQDVANYAHCAWYEHWLKGDAAQRAADQPTIDAIPTWKYWHFAVDDATGNNPCLLYTSPSPRD